MILKLKQFILNNSIKLSDTQGFLKELCEKDLETQSFIKRLCASLNFMVLLRKCLPSFITLICILRIISFDNFIRCYSLYVL